MHLSRLALSGAGLLVLFSTFSLGTSCGDEKSKLEVVRLACQPNVTVKVDPASPSGVQPTDIYVCENSTVTWQANASTNFTVFFKNHKCPFDKGCKIDQTHPTSGKMLHLPYLTVFDYGVSIEGDVFDPHVVGGGGP